MPAHAAYRLLPENVSIISKHTPRRLTCTVLSLSSSLPPPAATIVEIPQFFSHAVWQSAQTFASSLLVSFLQMFSILVIRLLIPCQDVLSTIRVVKGNSIPYHIVKLEACHWFSYLFFALVISKSGILDHKMCCCGKQKCWDSFHRRHSRKKLVFFRFLIYIW